MPAERQPIDHRDRRLLGELGDDRVRSRPSDDRVDEPLEVAGDVVDALPGAHDRVLGQVDGVPAELVHARLECHPGAEAGLLEQQRERSPDERRVGVTARREELLLELRRALEGPQYLIAAKVGDGEQVAAAKGRRVGDGVHLLT